MGEASTSWEDLLYDDPTPNPSQQPAVGAPPEGLPAVQPQSTGLQPSTPSADRPVFGDASIQAAATDATKSPRALLNTSTCPDASPRTQAIKRKREEALAKLAKRKEQQAKRTAHGPLNHQSNAAEVARRVCLMS